MAKRKKAQRTQSTEAPEKEQIPNKKMAVALTAKAVQAKREKSVPTHVNPVAQRAMMPQAHAIKTEADSVQAIPEETLVSLASSEEQPMEQQVQASLVQEPESDSKGQQEKASLLRRILSWREEASAGRHQVAASAEALHQEAYSENPDDSTFSLEGEEPSLEFDLDEPEYDNSFDQEDLAHIDVGQVLQDRIAEVTAYAEELHQEHEEVKRQEGVLKFKRSEKERKLTLKQIATILQVEQSTIRFWEKEFAEYLGQSELKGQRKLYDQNQLEILTKIRELLQTEQYTIKGAKRRLELDNLLAASLGIEPSFKSTVFVMFAAIMQELEKYREESKVLSQKVAALRDEKEVIEEKLQEEQNRGFLEFLRQKVHSRKINPV